MEDGDPRPLRVGNDTAKRVELANRCAHLFAIDEVIREGLLLKRILDSSAKLETCVVGHPRHEGEIGEISGESHLREYDNIGVRPRKREPHGAVRWCAMVEHRLLVRVVVGDRPNSVSEVGGGLEILLAAPRR